MIVICRTSTRGQSHQNFTQPITSSAGIYFDYLGTLKINNAHLKILIPLDISHIKPHIQNIKYALDTTRHLCQESHIVEISTECHNMLQPLTVRYQDMNKEFESISHLLDNRVKRSAWIGGIGSLLKQIFGTLDEDDALRYDEAIETVQTDQAKLASLMKQNILVTTSVMTSYNSTLNKIKNNEANLNTAIDRLSLSLQQISNTTNGLIILNNINEIFDSLETSILTLSFQLEDITNAVLFSSHNTLHPAIITPQQLYRELADNYRHLPSDLELPVTLDINSMYLVLRICKVVCYYINNKIVFLLEVPLVKAVNYMLFHNIALPTPYNSKEPHSFSLIIPNNKYIAMTKDKSHYCNVNDLQQCKTVQSGTYICDVTNVYAVDAKPTCESELLSKVISEIPVQCETKFISGKLDIWKTLANNKWIYIQSESTKISIDCVDSRLYETNILGTGILSIPDGCVGFCKSTTLIPKYNALNISSPMNYIPDYNLLNDNCCNIIKFNSVTENVPHVHLQDIDLDQFNSKNKIITESLLNNLNTIENKPHIVKYGTHYSSLVIIVIIIILTYGAYLVYKKLTCKRSRRTGNNQPTSIKLKDVKRSSPQPTSEITNDLDSDTEIGHIAPLRTQV